MKVSTYLKTNVSILDFGMKAAMTMLMSTTVLMMFGISKDALVGYVTDSPMLVLGVSAIIAVASSMVVDRGLGKSFVSGLVAIMDKEYRRWNGRAKFVTIAMFALAAIKLVVSGSLTYGSAEYISIETTAPPDTGKGLSIAAAKNRAKKEAKAALPAAKADHEDAIKAANGYVASVAATGTPRQQEMYASKRLGEFKMKGVAWGDSKYAAKVEAAIKEADKRKERAAEAYTAAKGHVSAEIAAIEAEPGYKAAAAAAASAADRDGFIAAIKRNILVGFDIFAIVMFIFCGFSLAAYITEVADGSPQAYEELIRIHFAEAPGLPDVITDLATSTYGVVVATFAWAVAKVKGRGASLLSVASGEISRNAETWRDASEELMAASTPSPRQGGAGRPMPTQARPMPTQNAPMSTRERQAPTPSADTTRFSADTTPTPRRHHSGLDLELGAESLIPRDMEPPLPIGEMKKMAADTGFPPTSEMKREGRGVGDDTADTDDTQSERALRKIASGHLNWAKRYEEEAIQLRTAGNIKAALEKVDASNRRMVNWQETNAKADKIAGK